jgi:hypothetical protein
MRIGTLSILALVAIVCLALLPGCGGGGNGSSKTTGTVTGEVYGAVGGAFVPLGGQTVTIGARTATTQTGTGRFVISGVTPGAFVAQVHADAGYGNVLNPERLQGTVTAGGSRDIGRILLGESPPDPPA